MANTYDSLIAQTVFAVKFRNSLILPDWKHELFSVIGNLINENGCKTYSVNGVSDHVHCLFSFKPKHSLSLVMKSTKSKSSKWLNESGYLKNRFEWQDGFGAFTYSQGQVDKVFRYIQNQESHHKKVTFLEEYAKMLSKYKIEYEDRYIFSKPQ